MQFVFNGPSFILGYLSFAFCMFASLFFVFLSVLIGGFAKRIRKQILELNVISPDSSGTNNGGN